MAREMAPDIARCVGFSKEASNMIPRALKYDCKKIQLMKPYFDKAMIDEAHSHGIICNVFWSDNPVQTRSFLEMGIDVILTNDYNLISQVVADFKAGK
jgi:glycerophosphoryl diester phosphodiesterase